jgi:hypothetical protein
VPLTSAQLATNSFGASTGSQYSMLVTDDVVQVNVGTSPSYAVVLPSCASMSGRVITIAKVGTDTTAVTINTASTTDKFDWGVTSTNLLNPGERVTLYCDGTAWHVQSSNRAPTRQSFTTTGAFTYTLPTARKPVMIRVKMVGGGGGGGGSATAANGTGSAGSSGGNTTFGTSFLTCTGGNGGNGANNSPQASNTGGTATIGTGAVGIALTGGSGGGGSYPSANATMTGGWGAVSPFGGGGGQQRDAIANTGSGGGGGENTDTAGFSSGYGGGAGGYIDAMIVQPSTSYTGSVGTGGGGGGGNINGSAGGSGVVIVEEQYQ